MHATIAVEYISPGSLFQLRKLEEMEIRKEDETLRLAQSRSACDLFIDSSPLPISLDLACLSATVKP